MKPNEYVLQQTLIQLRKEQLNSIPADEDIHYNFSATFEKNMNQLIRSQKHSYWKYINTVGRRVAVILLTLAVVFTSAMSVKAIREPVIKFLYKVYETFTEVVFKESDTHPKYVPIENNIFTLQNVPDGYTQYEYANMENLVTTYWRNSNGNEIFLQQSITNLNSDILFDSENGETIEKNINGINVLFCNNGDTIYCIWNDENYTYLLYYPANLGEEFAEQNIGNLILKE